MQRVFIRPHWKIGATSDSAFDTNQLLQLLAAVQDTGAIAQAARSVADRLHLGVCGRIVGGDDTAWRRAHHLVAEQQHSPIGLVAVAKRLVTQCHGLAHGRPQGCLRTQGRYGDPCRSGKQTGATGKQGVGLS